jgi:hypothetical protein
VKIAGDDNLLIFGVANDFTGYVVPPNDFLLNPDVPYVNTTRIALGEGITKRPILWVSIPHRWWPTLSAV